MRHVALFLLWPLALSAQTAKPEEFCIIEGRVLNSVTGEPVVKASLLLMRTDSSSDSFDWTRSYAASSDSTGKFEIRNIEPGKYRLRASRNGFITHEYGARISQRSGTMLDLNRSEQLKDIDVRLTPHVVISGRILDGDGEPMVGAQVQLLRTQYVKGKKLLSRTNTANTNDLGEYRWAGLTPGRYYLYADSFQGSPPTSVATEDYVPVYYPGASDPASAMPLDLTAGTQVRVADMMLRKGRTATVKGRVVVALAGARGIPDVRLFREIGHDTSSAGSSFRVLAAKVNSAGEFESRGVTPGSYTAQAQIGKDGRAHAGWVPIEVSGTDIEGVVITIGNGVSLTGRVRIEGESKPDLQIPSITLQAGGPTVDSNTSYRIAADGSFKIDNLDPNRYGVLARGLPDGFYTKSVRAGGVDVTHSGVELKPGASAEVEVLVSPKAGLVSGVTQNHKTSQPAGGATVVMIPKEKERLGNIGLHRQATTDQYGRFTLKSVVPGEYKVFAWEDVESTAWLDPDFMKPLDGKGESVTVGESAQAIVHLNVIPADSEKQ